MKQEIEKIIREEVDISTLEPNGVKEAVEELEQLMCYREVRAYWMCFNDFNEPEDYDIEQEILGSFYDEYPEEMLLKAIEQYKSEQKS